ncbi:iron-sulfur cluster-binding protein [candidate division TA06 bacterium DG_26]|uniref:Iron-sulfur cluster-binding protein n=1 Tax=candidate division TA06 bacterium DG_26 TaxID=1703771 RepID=A0A0S7WIW8_UNCT6|nr:MAG: iron-sulfur cluster-binding protein [candidate division TA06 bacterium DG_26]
MSEKARVAVVKTRPETVCEDYQALLDLFGYRSLFSPDDDIIVKLNLSWTRYYPASSSEPWQLEGLVKTLLRDGFRPERIYPLENKTVVTDPHKGAFLNKWTAVLEKYGLEFISLTEAKWITYQFKTPLLRLNELFPEGIEIPEMFVGKSVIHLPTVKTHGHSITTGAIKNAFGGLLKEVRHYGHEFIHEVLVDLLLMQKEIHPKIFAVMDGTVCGNGAGPRTMTPVIVGYILASDDQVAIDAVAARMMGFDPLTIDYLRIAHEFGLGVADLEHIDIVGEEIGHVDLHFHVRRSFVIWGDQMLRRGTLRFLKRIALHSPLWMWAPIASYLYHDVFWYPLIGRWKCRKFLNTSWGRLFQKY